jgi:hypothetical protein
MSLRVALRPLELSFNSCDHKSAIADVQEASIPRSSGHVNGCMKATWPCADPDLLPAEARPRRTNRTVRSFTGSEMTGLLVVVLVALCALVVIEAKLVVRKLRSILVCSSVGRSPFYVLQYGSTNYVVTVPHSYFTVTPHPVLSFSTVL